jgi:DNA mismatch endonuclease (patch repair protein)
MIGKSAQYHAFSGDAGAADAGISRDAAATAAKRRQMARVKTQDTAPEIAVRRAAHALGLRFRLHRRDLPGRPDIVFPRRRAIVFVHGCYWHGCVMCDRGIRRPKTNVGFWAAKLEQNQRRDARNAAALKALGWHVAIIWECETRDPETLAAALDRIIPVAPDGHRYGD